MRRKFSDRDARLLLPAFVEDALYRDVFDRLCDTLVSPGDLVFLGGGRSDAAARRLARRVGPGGRLIAIEALPEEARRLAESLAADGQAEVSQVFNAALYHARGKLAFMQLRNSHGPQPDAPAGEEPPPVPSVPPLVPWHYDPDIAILRADALLIDDFLAHDLAARFIRLDLEGAEFPALQGGERTLRQRRPVVLFDHGGSASAARHNYDSQGFFGFFDALDYHLIDLYGRPFGPEAWGRMPAPWRLLALPRASRDGTLAAETVYGVVRRLANRHRREAWHRWWLR